MKLLKIYINRILIEQVPIMYDGLITCEERQRLHETVATDLMIKHHEKIVMSNTKPEIFVTAESKMNLAGFRLNDEVRSRYMLANNK